MTAVESGKITPHWRAALFGFTMLLPIQENASMMEHPGSFEDQYATDYAEPPRTSGMAVASLVCGLLGCCPFITSVLAVILGGGSLVAIGRNPALRGKGLALAGLALGVLGLAAWGGLTGWAVVKGREFSAFAQQAPEQAMQAASAGDYAGFRNLMSGSAATASDEQVRRFISELESRYGAFSGARFNPTRPPSRQPRLGEAEIPYSYDFQFANATVPGEMEFAFTDPNRGGFKLGITSITILDPQAGQITFPASAPAVDAPPSSAPPANSDGS